MLYNKTASCYNKKRGKSEEDMKKVLLIYNPVSGKNSRRKSVEEMTALMKATGADVDAYVTERRGSATDKAAEAEGYDVIAVAGGDGTLNEVLNGIVRKDEASRPAILYIPSGTTNQTATAFGLPTKTKDAIALLRNGETKAYDLGRFNDRVYIDVTGFGYGTESSLTTLQKWKNRWGFKAFLYNQAKYLFKIKPVHMKITYDGGEIEDDFVFGNLVNTAMISTFVKLNDKGVAMDDGYLDLILIKNVKNVWQMPAAFIRLLQKKFDGKRSFLIHAKHFTLTPSAETVFLIDGERRVESTPVTVDVLPGAFKLYIPKK